MSVTEQILENIEALPPEKRQELLEFSEFLVNRHAGKGPRRSLEGLWADLGIDITDEDIAEIRREMWGNFPREDIV